MKDISFHDIVISKNDQKIVSADAWIYKAHERVDRCRRHGDLSN